MDKKQYTFSLPIGDWSDDGHGECEYYNITSNKPVEQVREAHYKIEEVTGINIEHICQDYEDTDIAADTVAELRELGFSFRIADVQYEADEQGSITADAWLMANLWVFLLVKADSELVLVLGNRPKEVMLPFYGFDEKKRHISFVGYGVFD